MSKKSLLVLDTPYDCLDCPCCIEAGHQQLGNFTYKLRFRCGLTSEGTYISDVLQKPDWCPLLPLPERKNLHEEVAPYNLYQQGYNDCLDDLQRKDN